MTKRERKEWNDLLEGLSKIKEEANEELKKIENETFLSFIFKIFILPIIGLGIISRVIFEALKRGWELGLSIIEVWG